MKIFFLLLIPNLMFAQRKIDLVLGTWQTTLQFNPIAGQNINTSGSFPNITFNASPPYTGNNKFMVLKAGVIRPSASGANNPITWAFLDTTSGHTSIGFDSVNGNGNAIQIFYPTTKNVSSMVVIPDETLASVGVIAGPSVGFSRTDVYSYFPVCNAGKLTGNTTTWTNAGLTISGLTYNTGNGLTQFSLTALNSTVYSGLPEVDGTIIQYVGTANRSVRRVFSGLSQQIGFQLVDSTNTVVTGNVASTDIVVISSPRMAMRAIPAQTTGSNGYPADIYTVNSNYWVIGVMELYMIEAPLTTTSIKVDWQSQNTATNYRITRAPMSSPNSETTIFNGVGFTVTDTGLTTQTQYKYRMYTTISGVESLLTNDKCTTL